LDVTAFTTTRPTSDRTIREVLKDHVLREHHSLGDTLLIEELGLFGGDIRADLAAFNGISHGYEIKSCLDSLERLPNQVQAYSAIFERATLVGSRKHLYDARQIIPQWWGIICVDPGPDGTVCLKRTRRSLANPRPDKIAIASLLWRNEALHLLESLGICGGLRSKPMDELVEQLAARINTVALAAYVRQAIRARGDWRSGARQKRDGVRSRPNAKSSRFRYISSVSSLL
jgi:hypothetical protein